MIRIFQEVVSGKCAVECRPQTAERLCLMQPEKKGHCSIEFLMRNQIKKCGDRKVGIIGERNVQAIREEIVQIRDQLIIIAQKDDVFFDMIVSDFEIMLKSSSAVLYP